MQITAKDIAQFIGGEIEGNPEVVIDRPSKIEEGGEGSITFLANQKYEPYVYGTTASAVLVSKSFKPAKPITATLIRVDNVYSAIGQLLDHFGAQKASSGSGVSDKSSIAGDVTLGQGVSVGDFTVIGQGTNIGDHCVIHQQVYIGKNVKLGKGCILHPGVRVMDDCLIGDEVILQPNAVIGADGFGFSPQPDGTYKKVPQIGNVIIEDRVEIGANTTVDRATMGSTIIREGAKLDNLIMIGHNAEVGAHTVIAGQSGVAGSTKLGAHCQVGGQVGFIGHLRIADGGKFQAGTGVGKNTKPDTAYFGYPALEYRDFARASRVYRHLPEIDKKLHQLKKEVDALKNNPA